MIHRLTVAVAFVSTLLLLTVDPSFGQLGSGWEAYQPPRKVHLAQPATPEKKALTTFEWKPHIEVGTPTPCASYSYDEKTDIETFKLFDDRSNRSEIRLHHDYGDGSRQFEGYVTFDAPLNDESLFQVWGSDEGATQLMMRGYAANGGEIGIANRIITGTPRVMKNCYGREIKVNVIHLQEDVGNKFLIYLDDKKVLEFADDERPKNNSGRNYHKYGCYGTLKTEGVAVKWRKVRHFKDGKPPAADATPAPLGAHALPATQPATQSAVQGKLIFQDDFQAHAQHTKEWRDLSAGWRVRAGHATWTRTTDGVASHWESGHMPVLQYEGAFGDAVIEVDFRYTATPQQWAACRISPTNPTLNPRAYAASVWANQDNKGRPLGMVLEHDEWKPGTITTVDVKPAAFESGKWYTLRMELIGNDVLASCNGVSVFGTHEKFGLPKTALSLGVGTCPHELRNLRIYEATRGPRWVQPPRRAATQP